MPSIRLILALILAAIVMPGAASANDQLDPDLRPELPTTIVLPSPCPGPNCAAETRDPMEPNAQGLRTIYLAFDGVTLTASNNNDDARSNISSILAGSTAVGQSKTIPAFNINDLWSTGGLSRSQIINAVVNELYYIHSAYNVEFVTQRPSSGSYGMIVFGGSCASVAGSSGCAGIALLDCGDFLPSNVVFVFPGSMRAGDLAATAAQEAAHAFGLSHTLDNTDVMYPQIQGSAPDRFGSGQVPQGETACGGASFQDSHQMMLDIIGFRGQDTIPPAVAITGPANGTIINGGETITAAISDNSLVSFAELIVNGDVVETKTSGPWNFTLPAVVPVGDVFVTVRATDDSDNTSFDRVVLVKTSGDEPPCMNNDDCDAGLVCAPAGVCLPPADGSLGSTCAGNGDCNSGMCVQSSEGEALCSQSCNETTLCPVGFECLGGAACWPEPKSSGGCSVGGEGNESLPGLAVMLGLALFGIGRRRRGALG